jgi:hypothetical protein
VRIEKDLQAIVPVTATPINSVTEIPIVVNNTSIQTVNGDNVQNQTNNTQIINLVVYNNREGDNIQFKRDHIDAKQLRKLFIAGDKVAPERLTNIMREWTGQILSHDDNKCVKKTNMRSSHSQVHVGENKWESRLDKEIYPRMVNSIANDFSDFFSEKYQKFRNVYKALEAFLDYMASDGYCANDKEKKIDGAYKTLVKELKLLIFDRTKQEVTTEPATST